MNFSRSEVEKRCAKGMFKEFFLVDRGVARTVYHMRSMIEFHIVIDLHASGEGFWNIENTFSHFLEACIYSMFRLLLSHA